MSYIIIDSEDKTNAIALISGTLDARFPGIPIETALSIAQDIIDDLASDYKYDKARIGRGF